MEGPEDSKAFFILTMAESNKAYLYLIKLLSARDYSEHKLKEKLQERIRANRFTKEDATEALNLVKEQGYLREEAYAEARVKGFMSKGYSPEFIRQKLAQEHLSVTEDTIGEIFSEYRVSEEDQIERLAKKKMGTKTQFDFDDEARILRFLISKGHDYGTSKKVLKSLIREVQEQLN